MDDSLYIGEIADLFSITTKTLRHYEKLGLLDPRRAENDYRLYGPEDVLRLQRIRQLQSLGMSLQQIKRVLESEDDEQLWTTVLRTLRDEVQEEIASLEERRERLEELLTQDAPPAVEELSPVPQRVNEYLEQHLPQASLQRWQKDRAVYAFLGALFHRSSLPGGLPLSLPGFHDATSHSHTPGTWPGFGDTIHHDQIQNPNQALPQALDAYENGVRKILAALRASPAGADQEEDQ